MRYAAAIVFGACVFLLGDYLGIRPSLAEVVLVAVVVAAGTLIVDAD